MYFGGGFGGLVLYRLAGENWIECARLKSDADFDWWMVDTGGSITILMFVRGWLVEYGLTADGKLEAKHRAIASELWNEERRYFVNVYDMICTCDAGQVRVIHTVQSMDSFIRVVTAEWVRTAVWTRDEKMFWVELYGGRSPQFFACDPSDGSMVLVLESKGMLAQTSLCTLVNVHNGSIVPIGMWRTLVRDNSISLRRAKRSGHWVALVWDWDKAQVVTVDEHGTVVRREEVGMGGCRDRVLINSDTQDGVYLASLYADRVEIAQVWPVGKGPTTGPGVGVGR